jgi:hypothetical protein
MTACILADRYQLLRGSISLIFFPEDGSSRFLQNTATYLSHYTAS